MHRAPDNRGERRHTRGGLPSPTAPKGVVGVVCLPPAPSRRSSERCGGAGGRHTICVCLTPAGLRSSERDTAGGSPPVVEANPCVFDF